MNTKIAADMIINSKHNKLVWLISEIVQITLLIMGGLILLWLYSPFNPIFKGIISVITVVIAYDIIKNATILRTVLIAQE